jgi:hypothetical protein
MSVTEILRQLSWCTLRFEEISLSRSTENGPRGRQASVIPRSERDEGSGFTAVLGRAIYGASILIHGNGGKSPDTVGGALNL